MLFSIVAFIVILQSTIYKNRFASKIPSDTLCSEIIPSLYQNVSTTASESSLELVRPSDHHIQGVLDQQCDAVIPSSFYAVYAIDGNFDDPVVPYAISSCSRASANDLRTRSNQSYSEVIDTSLNRPLVVTSDSTCPVYGQSKPYCPCISTRSSSICYSKSCQNNIATTSCVSFRESFIGYCYCKAQLLDILVNVKSLNVFNELRQSSSSCRAFFVDYSSAIGISYMSIFVTFVINKILLYILNKLTVSEMYNSLGKSP